MRSVFRGFAALALIITCCGFDLFRSQNDDVTRGNRLLEGGKPEDLAAAVEAYRRAQRQLPDERGIDLNLGIALGKQGEFKKGAEHLETAAGARDPALRAQALYNLGNLFFRQADKVKEPKSEEEAKLRMEALGSALGAFRRSLETQMKSPLETRIGNLQADTRWNLELTLRELKKDEEKRQQQQQQQQNGQNGQNQQQQNGQNGQQQQNGQGNQQQQQNGQNGQQQQNGQNGQNGQQQQNGQNGQQNSQNGQNGQNQQQNGQNGGGQQNQQNQQNGGSGNQQQQNQQQQNGQNGQNPQQNGQQQNQQGGQNGQQPGQGQQGGACDPSKEICGQTPGDALLDALERSEKNLALERARNKPGLRRKPVKDW